MKDTRDSQDRTSPANATDERSSAPDTQKRSDAASSESLQDDEPTRPKAYHLHNTPPPIIIGDGSVFLEVRENLQVHETGVGGNPKKKEIRPSNGKKYKFHYVRMLEGNGETYAQFDPSDDCEILIYASSDPGRNPFELRVACNGPFFLEYPPAEEFRNNGMGNSSKRVHYGRRKSNKETGITRVVVRNCEGNNQDITAADLLGNSFEDFKLMLWIEEVDV